MTETNKNRDLLNDKWKERFEILDNIEGQYLKRGGELSGSDRAKISFRFFALIFGPGYYLFHRMWHKGLILLILSYITSLLFSILDFDLSPDLAFVPVCAICAALATSDYYHKVVHDEKVWPFLSSVPQFLLSVPAMFVYLVAIISIKIAIFLGPQGVPNCGDDEAVTLVKNLYNDHVTRLSIEQTFDRSVNQVNQIRTLAKNEETGASVCDAQITTNQGYQVRVSYTVNRDEAQLSGFVVQLQSLEGN